MATKKAASKKVPTTSNLPLPNEYVLSGDELLSHRPPQRLEIPELSKDGRPAVVYIRDLYADELMSVTGLEDTEQMYRAIALSVVTPDGQPIFTEEQAAKLRTLRVGVFAALAKVVNDMLGRGDGSSDRDSVGNVSSEAETVNSSASPTGSVSI